MTKILLAALAVTICAPVAAASGEPPKCSTAGLEKFIGRAPTIELAHKVTKRAGVANARGIGPGQAVTMDYSADRLNIYMDEKGNITRFTCG